jgi:hypothetical protein
VKFTSTSIYKISGASDGFIARKNLTNSYKYSDIHLFENIVQYSLQAGTLSTQIQSRYLIPRMGRFNGEVGDTLRVKSDAVAQL